MPTCRSPRSWLCPRAGTRDGRSAPSVCSRCPEVAQSPSGSNLPGKNQPPSREQLIKMKMRFIGSREVTILGALLLATLVMRCYDGGGGWGGGNPNYYSTNVYRGYGGYSYPGMFGGYAPGYEAWDESGRGRTSYGGGGEGHDGGGHDGGGHDGGGHDGGGHDGGGHDGGGHDGGGHSGGGGGGGHSGGGGGGGHSGDGSGGDSHGH